ncbi:MAG: hypothetical protein IKG27_04135 [Bacilli bacterium]|nr:hypothetical protein [Bacilli bacterium]
MNIRNNHKNVMIALLLGILVVMAVGYAAFSTTLTINGTAAINTTWDVHFNPSIKTVTPTTGFSGGTAPSGNITLSSDNLTATLTATLNQPGDQVQYVLQPKNFGNITAKTTGSVAYVASGASTAAAQSNANSSTSGGAINGSGNYTVGNIKYTVSFSPKTSIGSNTADNNITVTVEFLSSATTTTQQYAAIHITVPYTQA